MAVSSGPHWLEAHTFDNRPVSHLLMSSICLGTSARADQFGARRTDRNGVVRFDDVRTVPLVLTASRSGYQGAGTVTRASVPESRAGVEAGDRWWRAGL